MYIYIQKKSVNVWGRLIESRDVICLFGGSNKKLRAEKVRNESSGGRNGAGINYPTEICKCAGFIRSGAFMEGE